MTTSIENGAHADSGELREDRDAYRTTLEQLCKQEVQQLGHTGLTSMAINEVHPFYADWEHHVLEQPHQGC